MNEQVIKSFGAYRIKVMLPIAPSNNDSSHAKQGQVVADCGLALLQLITQSRHVQLIIGDEKIENPKAGLIAEKFEGLAKLSDRGVEFASARTALRTWGN